MKGNRSTRPPRGRLVALRALLTGLILLWGAWGWGAPTADEDDDSDAGDIAIMIADSAAAEVRTAEWQPDQPFTPDDSLPSLTARARLSTTTDPPAEGVRPSRVALCRSNR